MSPCYNRARQGRFSHYITEISHTHQLVWDLLDSWQLSPRQKKPSRDHINSNSGILLHCNQPWFLQLAQLSDFIIQTPETRKEEIMHLIHKISLTLTCNFKQFLPRIWFYIKIKTLQFYRGKMNIKGLTLHFTGTFSHRNCLESSLIHITR